MENFNAQVAGVFLAETVKNVAKGSANALYSNFNLLFYSEITTLGLSEATGVDEIANQLEAKPEMLESIQLKLLAFPKLAEEMSNTIKKNTRKLNKIQANNYIEKVDNFTVNQSGGQTAQTINNFPSAQYFTIKAKS